jgi:cytochrome P450
MIVERRARPRSDLLSQLVARESDDALVRATFKQWLGADQLHALFTWTLHLLAANPEAERRWHSELDEVLGDRAVTTDDIARLPYTVKVIKESMRVIPPVWGFFRELTSDYRLGDELIPQGHLMAMSPWVTHRDVRVWPDPLRFDPERWGEGVERPPPLSYFPFSSGPYECHGRGLAMKEAVLMMATIGQRWAFRPAGMGEPQPMATWATEPKRGLRMKPARRP